MPASDPPAAIRTVLTKDARAAWAQLRDLLPPGTYLAGGTAVALRFQHRRSEDLDFFTTEYFSPEELHDLLMEALPSFGGTRVAQRLGSLGATIGSTKVEFTNAVENPLIEPTEDVWGIPVAGVGDLLAMKLAAILKRRRMRDLHDLFVIEADGGRTVEEGLGLLAERYNPRSPEQVFREVAVRLAAAGSFDDDPLVPVSKAGLVSYWKGRAPQILESVGRYGGSPRRASLAEILSESPAVDTTVSRSRPVPPTRSRSEIGQPPPSEGMGLGLRP